MVMKSFHAMRQNEVSNDNVLNMQMNKNGMIMREKVNRMKRKRSRESMNLRLHIVTCKLIRCFVMSEL